MERRDHRTSLMWHPRGTLTYPRLILFFVEDFQKRTMCESANKKRGMYRLSPMRSRPPRRRKERRGASGIGRSSRHEDPPYRTGHCPPARVAPPRSGWLACWPPDRAPAAGRHRPHCSHRPHRPSAASPLYVGRDVGLGTGTGTGHRGHRLPPPPAPPRLSRSAPVMIRQSDRGHWMCVLSCVGVVAA
jgi:hypothetical protein